MSKNPSTSVRFSTVVDIQRFPSAPEADQVKNRYTDLYGAEPEDRGGWYHPADWGRTSYVLSRLRHGPEFLDVGVGAGQFMNMVAVSGMFERITALDPTRFRKYTEMTEGVTRFDRSIADTRLPDDAFDTVTCMEVLEHIPTDVFEAGLAELRRVCRGQLLMTVPFKEPPPMSKGHVRRFNEGDIEEIFPEGHYTILDRPKRPWILIEERFDGSEPDAVRIALDSRNHEIAVLQQRIETLNSRKMLRLADWAARQARNARRAVRSVAKRS